MKLNLKALTVIAPVLALSASAFAAPLVDFTPIPTSNQGVVFDGLTPATRALDDGPGFSGPATGGTAGVILRSVVAATGVPAPVDAEGYYVFSGVSLQLGGLAVAAPAVVPVPGVVVQPLTGGTFKFIATGGQTLLEGTFDGATSFSGTGAIGGFLAPTITYTGGAILTTLLSIPGTTNIGDAVLNASQVTPPVNTSGGYLAPLSARVQGQFTTPVIPEPATAMALGPVALVLARRRRA